MGRALAGRHGAEILIALLTTLVFAQSVGHGFIIFDDPAYITANINVRDGLSWKTVRWAFSTTYFGNWSPLVWLSHALDCQLYGLDAWGHHLSNVVLHTAACLLFYTLLLRLKLPKQPSVFAALVFAVHPLHVEPVAWISSRKDLLSSLFFFLSIHCYLRFLRSRSVRDYVMLLLSFLVGLMAKPSILYLPIVLLCLDVWPLERVGTSQNRVSTLIKLLVEKLPLLVIAVFFGLVTSRLQHGIGASPSLTAQHLLVGIKTSVVLLFHYLEKLVMPVELAVIYADTDTWHLALSYGAYWVLLSLLFAAAGIAYRRAPAIMLGLLWMVMSLLPYLQVLPVGIQSVADRWAYLSVAGFAIALCHGSYLLVDNPFVKHRLLPLCLILLIGVYSAISSRCIANWKSNVTLFRHSTVVTHHNHHAFKHLGYAYLADNDSAAAENAFLQGLKLKPHAATIYSELHKLLTTRDQEQQSAQLAGEALKIRTNDALEITEQARILTEVALNRRTRQFYKEAFHMDPLEQALTLLDELIESRSSEYLAWQDRIHHQRGVILYHMAQLKQALAEYRTSMDLNARMPRYLEDAAVVYLRMKDFAESKRLLEKAIAIGSFRHDNYLLLGYVTLQLGNPLSAIEDLLIALQIKPKDVKTRIVLAQSYLQANRMDDFSHQLSILMRMAPHDERVKQLHTTSRNQKMDIEVHGGVVR